MHRGVTLDSRLRGNDDDERGQQGNDMDQQLWYLFAATTILIRSKV